MVDQVYSTNGWAIIFFHNVIPDVNNDLNTISSQDFASFLDYIISKGVQTLTVNQALDLGSPPVTPPSVTISPTSVRMYVGQSQTFSSSVSGGEPPYTYQWYLNNAAVSGANSISWTFTPTQAGFYNVYLNITDSLNNKAQSNIVNDIQVYNQYPLTMSTNYGTVSPSSGQYDVGSTISISATAPVAAVGESYVWLGWTGSGVGSYTGMNNPASITMNGAITETASWTHQYYLTISSPYGTTSGQGWYNSGATAYASLNTGTVSGGTGTQYVFSGWSGDASGTSYAQSNGITMNAPRTATANWKTQYLVSFAVSPSGAGTTSPSGTNLWEDAGTLSISATPNVGYTFSSWSSSTGSITFTNANLASTAATISGAGTITANFNRDTYTITASTGSGGSISPSGAVTVNWGDSRAFTITPDTGYHVADVLVDGVSVGAVTSYTFSNVQADHTISASFAITTFTITFTESGLPSGTSWSVTFGSLTQSSTIATITFTGVTNGSYSWNALTPISGGAGIRYVASPLSGTMNVPGQTSQTITYAAQYYLTVASAYGSASGGDWYDAGASAYATVTPLTVAGSASVRYVFTSWSGDASGTNSQSNSIVMNAAATATANYKTQYYITVMSAHGGPRSSAWIDAGKDFSVSVTSPADIVPGDHRFVCTGFSVDGGALKIGTSYDFTNVEAAHTIVFNWKEQFWIVFQQTGLPDGVTANVVVNSAKHTLPYSDWFDQGLSLEFAYEDQLPSGFGTQYVLTSTSDSPPLKVGASINVTGHYDMQYTIEMFGLISIPIILVVSCNRNHTREKEKEKDLTRILQHSHACYTNSRSPKLECSTLIASYTNNPTLFSLALMSNS